MATTTTSERIFQASDLRRDRAFIDEARKHGGVRLRDTDGTSFVMVPEREFARLAVEGELLELARSVIVLDRALDRQEDVRPLLKISKWPWLSLFETDDIRKFVNAVAEETLSCIAYGDATGVYQEIDAWRESGRALDDPERLAALTAPVELEGLAEITPE